MFVQCQRLAGFVPACRLHHRPQYACVRQAVQWANADTPVIQAPTVLDTEELIVVVAAHLLVHAYVRGG